MSPGRGKFITFEGGDGCGKSTQLALAEIWLADSGYDFFLTREPGGTVIGEKVREMLLDRGHAEMTDMTEMLLYAASRAQLAREVIEPELARGRLVICDRWVDSSIVYQGAARGLGEAVSIVNTYAAGGLFSPDATILLDLDPHEAISRAAGQGGGDRIEALGAEYQKKVREAYLTLAAQDEERFHIIDAGGSPAEVHARVCAALEVIIGSGM